MSELDNASRRRELAMALQQSDGWNEIVVPHIRGLLDNCEEQLLNGDLSRKQAAGLRAVRTAVKSIRDLPGILAPANSEPAEGGE